jgi:CBS domain containing-hemolysin-like protein
MKRKNDYSIFQFGDTVAREVMVPRIDMGARDHRAPGRSDYHDCAGGPLAYPGLRQIIDHIRGLLYAKDLLKCCGRRPPAPIASILRPAHFVPESKKADDLLADLQQRKIHLAVVVDEYGGTAGLVTIEDLIEEIVGEIRDEYDLNEEEVYQRIADNEYIADAASSDDLNRLLDWISHRRRYPGRIYLQPARQVPSSVKRSKRTNFIGTERK